MNYQALKGAGFPDKVSFVSPVIVSCMCVSSALFNDWSPLRGEEVGKLAGWLAYFIPPRQTKAMRFSGSPEL